MNQNKINQNISEPMPIDKSISSFIKAQTAVTIATSNENVPYCATCFYSFLEKYNAIAFKSSRETQHIIEAMKNKYVAGTIVPDKSEVGKIKGVQFSGIFVEPSGDLLNEAKNRYYIKYPFAAAFKGELWVIDLSYIKFTDNTLGFGKKLQWDKTIVPPF